MFRPEAEAAPQPAARHVVRGIYGDELNAKVRAEGVVEVDERTDQIPRFGATDYLPLDEGQLQQQFRQRVESAGSGSCLAKHKHSRAPLTRLQQIVALAEDDCERFCGSIYHGVCSNPNPDRVYRYRLLNEDHERKAFYGTCNHMFTLLLDKEQVQKWLVNRIGWLNQQPHARRYLRDRPAAAAAHGGSGEAAKELLCADRLSPADRQRGESMAAFAAAASAAGRDRWSCRENPVWAMLRSRLELPFHATLMEQSVYNTLGYMWNHMKCGVYVKIRQGKLAMFVPFHNLEYKNAWAEAAKEHLPGSASFKQSMEDYYAEKQALCGKYEYVLADVERWWANGNILCNQQVDQDEHKMHPHFWGDNHLPQMKDMIQQTCKSRTVHDCDFFLNKRDYPQLKADLTEPYDFLYPEDDPPLPREKHESYAPILSYYTSPEFADIPFPCGEDWMTAIGDFFPPKANPNYMKENAEDFKQQIQQEADAVGKHPWEMKRATAIFRGSGTGGGNTPEDNQRLKLHQLSEDWAKDDRYNGSSTEDKMPYLDAACTQWNFRDKKLKGEKMTFFRDMDVGLSKGGYINMFKQVKYKYHIYAEGHCAANRYAQMMRLGCVIIKVESRCKASELWFFPALVPYQDHVPVKEDLSDLAEQIEWCKTHDRECRQIAERSEELYKQLFSEEGVKDYCALIFNEISHRFHLGAASNPAPAAPGRPQAGPVVPPWNRVATGPTGMKVEAPSGGLQIPEGWLECSEAGTPLLVHQNSVLVLPCKAPLGPRFRSVLEEGSHFKPTDIVKHMRSAYNREVGLVLNLSGTDRWYEPKQDWPAYTQCVHLDCGTRGGESLDGATVNEFCWKIDSFLIEERKRVAKVQGAPRSIVVHCTHGHNRTGFMICCYLLRTSTKEWNSLNHGVHQVARHFAKARPPGIYKPEVLAKLFWLHNETVPPTYPCPKLPEWKRDLTVNTAAVLAEAVPAAPAKPRTGLAHDDAIGEEVPRELANSISGVVSYLVTKRQHSGSGAAEFPGNHPVNLTRDNIHELKDKHLVTWKADGTRYLMLIQQGGAYLIGRGKSKSGAAEVRRIQMRCPAKDGGVHVQTLLDGEMVVDDLPDGTQKRRFLVYDILSSGHGAMAQPLRYADMPFEQRWKLIKDELAVPYTLGKQHELIDRSTGKTLKPVGYYDYAAEEFTIRRKEFWSLEKTSWTCKSHVPQLTHESDGLIFQPSKAKYETGRCHNLFKWKFAHLNSVDFFFKDGDLYLDGDGLGRGAKKMPGFKAVVDPTREDQAPGWPHAYNNNTIECVWVDAYITEPNHSCPLTADGCEWHFPEDNTQPAGCGGPCNWVFLRDRGKKGANGIRTYNGIMQSVVHRMSEDQVIAACDEIRGGQLPSIGKSQADINRHIMTEHYDRTVQNPNADYVKDRERSKSIALRRYHNDVKRAMVARFAKGAPKVLDLASGRGGDLQKWAENGVQYVLGLDISPEECKEANRRYSDMRAEGKMYQMQAEYRPTDKLGVEELHLLEQTPTPQEGFAVVSCMFAFHYFFADLQTLKTFLKTVSINLREGGIFMGCLPDGLRIKELVEQSDIFKNSMLTIKKKWRGKEQPFGSTYTFAIADTVTAAHDTEDDEGSEEYLAMLNTMLEMLARKEGLELIKSYCLKPELRAEGEALEALLDPADVEGEKPFKHFYPPFLQEQPDLAYASLVNATFVFAKVGSRPPPGQQQQRPPAPAPAPPPAAPAPTNDMDVDGDDDGGWGEGVGDAVSPALAATDAPADAPAASAAAAPAAAAATEPEKQQERSADDVARSREIARSALQANRQENDGRKPTVAIIVCFRIQAGQRREQELQQFVPHMRAMMDKLKKEGEVEKYHIFVIQQRGSQDKDGIKFNRGKLLNIGFDISPPQFDTLIFHDVDLLPGEDLAPYYACYPRNPIHIASCWHQRGYTQNEKFFGGIVSFSRVHFQQINGYPNNFWGWGGEDEVLRDRCTHHRIEPAKVQVGSLVDIETNADGQTMDMDMKLEWLKKNKQWKCDDRWERRDADRRDGWKTNGVSTLAGTYAEQRALKEDISKISTEAPEGKRLKGKKMGKVATRIVFDLLFGESEAADKAWLRRFAVAAREPPVEQEARGEKRGAPEPDDDGGWGDVGAAGPEPQRARTG